MVRNHYRTNYQKVAIFSTVLCVVSLWSEEKQNRTERKALPKENDGLVEEKMLCGSFTPCFRFLRSLGGILIFLKGADQLRQPMVVR